MSYLALSAITPQLIIASGIFLALLLVAWRRSKRLIASFTLAILVISLIATMQGLGSEKIAVTALLAVDDYSRYSFMLVLITSIFCLYLSHITLNKAFEVHDEYYLLLLLVVLGAGVLVTSDHFASLFLGFELLSIALVGLVGYFRQTSFAVETGFKYLILSASASSFMLLGIAFIYAQVGDLTFSHATQSNLAVISESLLYQLGFILFFSGIAFKLSLVPFHFWTPDVYQGASAPVTLMLASISKCAMFVVLLKCCFTANHVVLVQNSSIANFISWVAILSMIIGNSLALKQQSVKRLLAYSSIAHMGYLLIVLLVSGHNSTLFAWQSVLFYLSAYLLASVSIFTVLALQDSTKGNITDIQLRDWQGIFWQQPLLGVLIIFSLLSFAGIPLTAGFIGKFYLVTYAANQALWPLLAALIVGSGIALAYYLPAIFILFDKQQVSNDSKVHTKINYSLFDKVLLSTLIASGLTLGVFPDVIAQFL